MAKGRLPEDSVVDKSLVLREFVHTHTHTHHDHKPLVVPSLCAMLTQGLIAVVSGHLISDARR